MEEQDIYNAFITKKTFWTLSCILVTVLGVMVTSISSLYITYYSGLIEIKSDMAVIKREVTITTLPDLKNDVNDIKKTLANYDFEVE